MRLTDELTTLASSQGAMVPAAEVRRLCRSYSLGPEELALAAIDVARAYASAPLTGFQVGAAALGQSGALYLGANFEFQAPHQTVHAEQAAVLNALLHEEAGITHVAASAAPCGHCRQFLYELASAEALVILQRNRPPMRLAELLPCPFGPQYLGIQERLSGTPRQLQLQWIGNPPPEEELARAALCRSYAPYSQAPAAVVLQVEGESAETMVTGPYVENAALNPSLAPLTSALVALHLAGLRPEHIQQAWLIQTPNSRIDHAALLEPMPLADGVVWKHFFAGLR